MISHPRGILPIPQFLLSIFTTSTVSAHPYRVPENKDSDKQEVMEDGGEWKKLGLCDDFPVFSELFSPTHPPTHSQRTVCPPSFSFPPLRPNQASGCGFQTDSHALYQTIDVGCKEGGCGYIHALGPPFATRFYSGQLQKGYSFPYAPAWQGDPGPSALLCCGRRQLRLPQACITYSFPS